MIDTYFIDTGLPRLNQWQHVELEDGTPVIIAARFIVPGKPWQGFYEVYSPYLDFSKGPHIFHDSEIKVP